MVRSSSRLGVAGSADVGLRWSSRPRARASSRHRLPGRRLRQAARAPARDGDFRLGEPGPMAVGHNFAQWCRRRGSR